MSYVECATGQIKDSHELDKDKHIREASYHNRLGGSYGRGPACLPHPKENAYALPSREHQSAEYTDDEPMRAALIRPEMSIAAPRLS